MRPAAVPRGTQDRMRASARARGSRCCAGRQAEASGVPRGTWCRARPWLALMPLMDCLAPSSFHVERGTGLLTSAAASRPPNVVLTRSQVRCSRRAGFHVERSLLCLTQAVEPAASPRRGSREREPLPRSGLTTPRGFSLQHMRPRAAPRMRKLITGTLASAEALDTCAPGGTSGTHVTARPERRPAPTHELRTSAERRVPRGTRSAARHRMNRIGCATPTLPAARGSLQVPRGTGAP